MNYFRLPTFTLNAFIVWYRNLLVYRKLLGPAIAMHFGEPLIYLFGLGFGLGAFVGQINEIPYQTFLASGLVASSVMMTSSLEGTYSVFTRMVHQNTYSAILATPIEIDDILLGEWLWCATKACLSGAMVLLVASLLGAVSGWSALMVIPIVLLSGLCFAGPAIVVASVSNSYDFFNYYLTLGIMPMFVLCGVFYPVSTLPEFLQYFVYLLPLTHVVQLIRPLIAGTPLQDVALHLGVLFIYAMVFYYIAVVMVRRKMVV